MRTLTARIFPGCLLDVFLDVFLGAALFSFLCGPQPASAQPAAWPGTVATPARPAPAPRGASCHAGMSFDRFLADLKQQAVAAGVSQRALAEASPGLVYDQGIVNRDRGQRVFGQIFTEFAGRMAAISRMQQGQARIKTYSAAFARAEKEYGVPPAVIAAFWGLESDFGANMGNLPTLRDVCERDHRRAENHRPRRSVARRDGRLLGRRARPDAILADALFQLRR